MPAKQKPTGKDDRFGLLFRDHPQPMCVFDLSTLRFLDVNNAAIEHYGYSREEFLRMTLADIWPEEETPRLPEALKSPQAPSRSIGQWRHRLKDGKIIHVEVAVHKIDYEGREAALAVLMDVTQRRLLEDQLRQAQKMEAVGMLAGGIAHDFNNLLTIITGYSQLLLSNLPESDRNRMAVEQIMKAGERAAALTRQLLAFSRRQVLQPRILDLNELIAGLGVMLRRLIGEDIDLRLVMGPDLGRVNADPGQIEQVIMNLVVNARDAMPHGGTLTVETNNLELDEHYAGAKISAKPGPYVMLAVSDTGIGMDEDTRARLFEPFFTTKAQGRGTGLGLSTVFGIIKQSGGSVEVYSERGQGTSVKVYLPRVDQPPTVEAEDRRSRLARGTETILLVEDDDTVRTLVRETLERQGYKLLDAADAVQARRICRTYDSTIDLLITDVVMPKEGGRELAQSLVKTRPHMKVLFISGYTDHAVVSSGMLERDHAFLQKPFTPATLAHKVREVLGPANGEQYLQAG